ncbi:MAG: hypothetical protein IJI59_15375 [Clostridia bacterium]|nr:hypothetical protein [Clostridia bacterium]
MNRNHNQTRDRRPANRTARPATRANGKRRAQRRRRNRFAPALAVMALLALAMIPLMIKLFPRDAATVPAARIDDSQAAQLAPRPTEAVEAPVVTLAPQATDTPTAAPGIGRLDEPGLQRASEQGLID